jgi:hypothetical protein
LAVFAAAILIFLLVSNSVSAQFPPPPAKPAPKQQQPPPEPIDALGTEVFRTMLAYYKLQAIEKLEELAKFDPKHTMVIAFRGAEATGNDPLDKIGLRQFVQSGGAVLVATDQDTSDTAWAKQFGVQVFGTKIFAFPGTPCYRDRNYCPFIEQAKAAQIPALFNSSTGAGKPLAKVATNIPSFMERSSLETLAYIKPKCKEEGAQFAFGGPVHFAQAKRYDSGGKIMIMADHSIFINEMLLPPKDQANDNLELTQNLLQWLTASPDSKARDHVLFIDQTGQVVTDFESLLRQLPPPIPDIHDLPSLLQAAWDNRDLLWANRQYASELVASAEDEGLFQEIEQRMDDDLLDIIPFWWIIRGLLFFALVIVFGLSIRRFVGSRFRFSKVAPRLSMALDRFRPRGSLLDQRLRGSLRGGQCYEAARTRARQMFADLEWTPAEEGGNLPRVEINAGYWKRQAIARDLRELWQVAFGREPIRVTAKHWDKWIARLREIHKLIRTGVIRVS